MNEDDLRSMWRQGDWQPFADYDEWAELTKQAYDVLLQAARSRELIPYGKIGSQIGLFSPDYFVVKIGSIVGACSVYEQLYGRPLISAIAVNAETREPSAGFWKLPGVPTGADRVEFWMKEVERVFEAWSDAKENAALS